MGDYERLDAFLLSIRNDVFKLLPMRDEEDEGKENFLGKYVETLLINLTGAEDVYLGISTDKRYLYVVNNVAYLLKNPVDKPVWRRIVLNCTRLLDELRNDQCGKLQKEV